MHCDINEMSRFVVHINKHQNSLYKPAGFLRTKMARYFTRLIARTVIIRSHTNVNLIITLSEQNPAPKGPNKFWIISRGRLERLNKIPSQQVEETSWLSNDLRAKKRKSFSYSYIVNF